MKRAVLKLMDRTGDTRQEFDLEDPKSKEAAQAAIDKARNSGALVVTTPWPGVQGEVVRHADQLAEENVVVPGIRAG